MRMMESVDLEGTVQSNAFLWLVIFSKEGKLGNAV
jgi:hypothetical protein